MFTNGGLRCGRNLQVNSFILLSTNTFVLVTHYLLYMMQCSYKDTSTIGFWRSFFQNGCQRLQRQIHSWPYVDIFMLLHTLSVWANTLLLSRARAHTHARTHTHTRVCNTWVCICFRLSYAILHEFNHFFAQLSLCIISSYTG